MLRGQSQDILATTATSGSRPIFFASAKARTSKPRTSYDGEAEVKASIFCLDAEAIRFLH